VCMCMCVWCVCVRRVCVRVGVGVYRKLYVCRKVRAGGKEEEEWLAMVGEVMGKAS
jgi:hypothetical protein